MSTEKDLEYLAIGYAVGGRPGLGLVGWVLLIKLVLLPVLGFAALVLYLISSALTPTGWAVLAVSPFALFGYFLAGSYLKRSRSRR